MLVHVGVWFYGYSDTGIRTPCVCVFDSSFVCVSFRIYSKYGYMLWKTQRRDAKEKCLLFIKDHCLSNVIALHCSSQHTIRIRDTNVLCKTMTYGRFRRSAFYLSFFPKITVSRLHITWHPLKTIILKLKFNECPFS